MFVIMLQEAQRKLQYMTNFVFKYLVLDILKVIHLCMGFNFTAYVDI